VNDVRLAGNPGPSMTQFQAYRPFNQDPEHWLAFTLQFDGAPSPVIEGARHAVARVDADLAVYNLGTVDSLIDESAANMRLIVQVLSIAATLGLLLSLVGIYGVVAHMAAQRTQEIGIRMALGASGGMVLWLILRNGARLALLGTGIGLLAAFAVGRALSLAIPSIPGQDPVVVVTLAVLMAAATLLACWIPALRATRVNPVEALRTE
jgi:ABC-type antimicrobial peptide transport system permease subunit